MQKKCIFSARLKTVKNDSNQTKLLTFDNNWFTDHKKYFQMWSQLHFISYLVHKKNIFIIISGPELRKTIIVQRPEIKFHENHEIPALNTKYKNCQKLNNSRLKFKK